MAVHVMIVTIGGQRRVQVTGSAADVKRVVAAAAGTLRVGRADLAYCPDRYVADLLRLLTASKDAAAKDAAKQLQAALA